jgi:acetyl-CoA carboxylase carboxyl transferase subunit alpha
VEGERERPDAAAALKLTSRDLKQLGVVDAVVPEPLGGAHRDPHTAAHNLEQFIARTLRELRKLKTETLLDRRYEKFRNLGQFVESGGRVAKAAG